ncbi:hypothetical protein ACFY97_10245 [Streptomyces klenkii]
MITHEEKAELARLQAELESFFEEFAAPDGLTGLGFDPGGGFFRGERIA